MLACSFLDIQPEPGYVTMEGILGQYYSLYLQAVHTKQTCRMIQSLAWLQDKQLRLRPILRSKEVSSPLTEVVLESNLRSLQLGPTELKGYSSNVLVHSLRFGRCCNRHDVLVNCPAQNYLAC